MLADWGIHHLHLSSAPGRLGYAEVTATFRHQGREGTVTQSWGPGDSGHIDVNWTCSHPGGVYRYTVNAYDQEGDHESASGQFKTVTAARCRSMHAAELARRERGSARA